MKKIIISGTIIIGIVFPTTKILAMEQQMPNANQDKMAIQFLLNPVSKRDNRDGDQAPTTNTTYTPQRPTYRVEPLASQLTWIYRTRRKQQ